MFIRKYEAGICLIALILINGASCVNESVPPTLINSQTIVSPKNGTEFNSGDTIAFSLLSDTIEPLQVLRFDPHVLDLTISHIVNFSYLDIPDTGRTKLISIKDTLQGYKTIKLHWIIPDSLSGLYTVYFHHFTVDINDGAQVSIKIKR